MIILDNPRDGRGEERRRWVSSVLVLCWSDLRLLNHTEWTKQGPPQSEKWTQRFDTFPALTSGCGRQLVHQQWVILTVHGLSAQKGSCFYRLWTVEGQDSSCFGMVSQHAQLYRNVVREVAKAVNDILPHPIHLPADLQTPWQSISPRTQRNKEISASFRTLFDRNSQSEGSRVFRHDIENIVTFMHSQREYKVVAAHSACFLFADLYLM